MSEAERRRRLNYKKNRKKLIFIQAVTMAVILGFIALFASVYYELDKTYYIDYTEEGKVSYQVQYAPNDFFDEEWQPSGQSYVPDLTETIRATFGYGLKMNAQDVDYDYTYKIDAKILVQDNRITTSNNVIYSPKYSLAAPTTVSQSSNSALNVYKSVDIDYSFYNDIAKNFIKEYGLSNVKCSLIVEMTVDVHGTSDSLISASENTAVVAMSMPLNLNPFDISIDTPASGENKVLAYKETANQNVYKGLAIACGFIEIALICVFIAFVYLTRNHDVNYSIKVQKIVSAYRSFIQTITNGFDTRGYQILKIATFVEMLGIRDTIQSPILMSENTDQTRAQFFIPTNTKILYLFEIKVDDYDKLYSEHPEWVDDSVIDVASEKTVPVEKPTEVKAESINTPEVESEKPERRDPVSTMLNVECRSGVCVDAIVRSATAAAVESAVREYGNLVGNSREQTVDIEPKIKVVEASVEIDHDRTADLVVSKLISQLASATDEKTVSEPTKIATPIVKAESVTDPAIEFAEEPEPDETIEFEHAVCEPIKITTPITEASKEVKVPTAEQNAESVAELEVTPEVTAEISNSIIEEAPLENEPVIAVETECVPEINEDETSKAVSLASAQITHPITDADSVAETAGDEDSDDDDGTIVYYDETGARLNIQCRRSCMANIIQSDNNTVKKYYSELKNYILSFKNVVARMSWRYETFKKGRYQLFRLKIRGKTICLYCALNPYEFDTAKYFHEAVDVKMFEQVPMLLRIRSDRGMKKAKELIDLTMNKFGLEPNPRAVSVDYVAAHPYERTQTLIDRELIKVLIPEGYVAIDPHHIVHAETTTQMLFERAAEEAGFENAEQFKEAITEAMAEPDFDLEEIDFVDEIDEVYEETDEKPGVEVVGVVWREREHGNRIYRYDPNGNKLNDGDEVLVPTKASSREIVRKAAVAHGNHKVDPEMIKHPLKKVISVVKRKIEDILAGE